MGDPFHGKDVPRGALLGAAALIGATLLAVGIGRGGEIGTVRHLEGAPVAVVELHFHDREDGGVAVHSAPDGRQVGELAPNTNGFARSVLRGLVRERRRQGIGADAPFRLSRLDTGGLVLDDPATGQHVDLAVFGHTNAAVFAELLLAGTARPLAAVARPQD